MNNNSAFREYTEDIKNACVLTIDIDWAPDFVIQEIADILIEKGIQATWFVTHDSTCIRRLIKFKDIFEFGLHPNFLPNSTQGSNYREIMDYLRNILPDTGIIRTHALVQSTRLFSMLIDEYSVDTDVSLFLPLTPNITPHMIYMGHKKPGLLRIPYFWEDDIEMYCPEQSWDFNHPKYHQKGLKVFDFHPMYIYLNAYNMKNYEKLKEKGTLNELKANMVCKFINKDRDGTRNMFLSFIDYLCNHQEKTYKISDVSNVWRGML